MNYLFYHYSNIVLQSLSRELLCPPYCEQITQFVLPVLAQGKEPFPFVQLLDALLPANQNAQEVPNTEKFILQADWSLSVEATPWLLCAVLTISENYLGICQVPIIL